MLWAVQHKRELKAQSPRRPMVLTNDPHLGASLDRGWEVAQDHLSLCTQVWAGEEPGPARCQVFMSHWSQGVRGTGKAGQVEPQSQGGLAPRR